MTVDFATKQDIEELKRIVRQQTQLLGLLLKTCNLKSVLTIADICSMKGMSRRSIERAPYLLPNCGVSDFPEGRARWNIETYEKWERIPIDTRMQMWRQEQTNASARRKERAKMAGR